MDRTFDCLVRWLAPMLSFTAEEASLARHGESPTAAIPASWHDPTLGARWAALRDLRRFVTGALEVERAQKRIGSSLQAAVDLYMPEKLLPLLREVDLAELCIVSAAWYEAARRQRKPSLKYLGLLTIHRCFSGCRLLQDFSYVPTLFPMDYAEFVRSEFVKITAVVRRARPGVISATGTLVIHLPAGAHDMLTLRALAPAYWASFTLSAKATVFRMRARTSSIVCSLSSYLGGVWPESQATPALT
jgi:hypothetical protein